MQDCTPAAGCADDGLSQAACVTVPTPFAVTFLDDEAVAISVDDDAVAALGLAPGQYWTAWSDGISCDRIVARFEVVAP